MNEQIIILVFLIIALGITLWLYISKAKKQVKYRGDERWQLIQLKASNAANLAHSILIVLIAVLPLFINMQTTVTLQRVSIFALLYIGIRNLIELVATIILTSDYNVDTKCLRIQILHMKSCWRYCYFAQHI